MAIKKDAYEANDSLTKATKIGVGDGRIPANIHIGTDEDWYRLELTDKGTADNRIYLSKSAPTQWIRLYNSKGQDISNHYEALKSQSLDGLAVGTYYVKVYDDAKTASGAYTLAWNNAAPAIKADSYEGKKGNNTMAAAWSLGRYGSINGTIHKSDDVDWYKITLTEQGTQKNNIYLSSSGGNQTIALYDSQGYRLTSSWYDFKNISLDGYAAGTYYVRVLDTYGNASGAYSLKWDTKPYLRYLNEKVAADKYEVKGGNDQMGDSSVISASKGELDATLHSGNDEDWYEFTLSEKGTGDNYISLGASRLNDVYMQIYNSDGGREDYSDGYSISMKGWAAGKYYVKVADDKGATGAYKLLWNTAKPAISADKYEGKKGNNTQATAYKLTASNGTISASIHSSGDEDWYEIDLDTMGNDNNFVFLSTTDANSQKLTVYNSSGRAIDYNYYANDAGYKYTLKNQDDGKYFIRVWDCDNNASGNYTLTWNTTKTIKPDNYENNNSRATAVDLTEGKGSIKANLHSGTDQDWFKFTLQQKGGATDKIYLSAASSIGQVISIYNSAGKKVLTAKDNQSLAGLARGTYYAQVTDRDGVASGDYTLS